MNCRNWAFTSVLLLTLVQLAYSSVGTPRITRVGRYLYDANGNRFYIKGVTFQAAKLPTTERGGRNRAVDSMDPLADINDCNQAIKNFKRLKINTIRVYSYDPEVNHSACMNALEKSGIYVIADINPSSASFINKASWDVDMLAQSINRIDSLRSFPNLLAFNIGNEIITNIENLEAGPYIKARARDVKLYLNSVNSTALVSYASTDGKKFPAELARFFSCHSGGPSAEIDLFGVNNYRWCGDSNFESAYEELTLEFQGLSIPAFLSEFGCQYPGKPRIWGEVSALFSTLMSDVWSGGIAYNYYPTEQGYGLLDESGGKWLRNKDFESLSERYQQVKPPNLPKLTSLAVPRQQCASTNTGSFAITSVLPPQPNAEACNCVDQAAFSCQVRKDASPIVISELLESICKAMGNSIPSPGCTEGCGSISSSPGKGTYGILSACSPTTRLNYAMTRYFINSGLDKKACDFSGNATSQNPIKLKSIGDVDKEVGRCFEINANKNIPRGKAAAGSQHAPAQISSHAYKSSISGARGKEGSRSSGNSFKLNVTSGSFTIHFLSLSIMISYFSLFYLFM